MKNSKRESAAAERAAHPTIAALDRPVAAGVNAAQFGSDVVADALRATGVPYIALNPGASYRGFHDSIVNYLGNEQPQMLLCLHEESAVAIAHGYAKVTGKAMAVAVHSNVGLMHATMAMFNAWCDRMPIVMLGATGPVDAAKRRPWIDWIHTAADQGALIRGYTKWDDQPASPAAAREAVLRANWIANTAPCGPTYVNLDAGMQEAKLDEPVPPIDAARLMPEVAERGRAGIGRRRRRPAAQGQASGDHGRPRLARSRGLERAHRARRAPGRARRHRPESRRRFPHRSSAACRPARRNRAGAGDHGGAARRRRYSQPRLARRRRHVQECRRRHRQGDPGLARPSTAQRLEHGLPGPAAGRRAARLHAGSGGAGAHRSARPRQGDAAEGGTVFVHAHRRQAHRRSNGGRAAPRSRRTAGIAHPYLAVVERREPGRSAIRSTISAPTAAAASAAVPAFRWARRWR